MIPEGGFDDLPPSSNASRRPASPEVLRAELRPTINFRTADDPSKGDKVSQVNGAAAAVYARFIDNPELSSHIVDLDEYFKDLRKGTLPAVSYIVPSGASKHPPGSIQAGERFIRGLLNALAASPAWSASAFHWTYDDWGGWYDHVKPPQVDEYGYGFRAPALMVSAYAKPGEVVHTQLDFTSILRFIEDNWNLEPLAERDANANSIADGFDFTRGPRRPEFIPAQRAPRVAPEAARRPVIYGAYGVSRCSPEGCCVQRPLAGSRSRGSAAGARGGRRDPWRGSPSRPWRHPPERAAGRPRPRPRRRPGRADHADHPRRPRAFRRAGAADGPDGTLRIVPGDWTKLRRRMQVPTVWRDGSASGSPAGSAASTNSARPRATWRSRPRSTWTIPSASASWARGRAGPLPPHLRVRLKGATGAVVRVSGERLRQPCCCGLQGRHPPRRAPAERHLYGCRASASAAPRGQPGAAAVHPLDRPSVEVPLLFFDAEVSVRDAVFGFPAGLAVRVRYPEGQRPSPLGPGGRRRSGRCREASTSSRSKGSGCRSPHRCGHPHQPIPLKLVTWLDLAVGLLALLTFLLGLPCSAGGCCAARRRRSRPRGDHLDLTERVVRRRP